jgi:hypothetical protein
MIYGECGHIQMGFFVRAFVFNKLIKQSLYYGREKQRLPNQLEF